VQQFEVFIPDIDDISTVESETARAAVISRLGEIDPSNFEDMETMEVVVHDELGLKSIFQVKPMRAMRFHCAKVG
jgi:hypothetical protein